MLVTAGLPLMRVVTKGACTTRLFFLNIYPIGNDIFKGIVIAMENGYFGTMLYVEAKLEGKVYGEEKKMEKQVSKSYYLSLVVSPGLARGK